MEQNTNTDTSAQPAVRPTKKQRELLEFLEKFTHEHGYSPSYREIMTGLGYNSVATVALHVGNLVKRGHVVKRDHSARSLEVVTTTLGNIDKPLPTNSVADSEEKWLVGKIEHLMKAQEDGAFPEKAAVTDIALLVDALRVLGLDGAASSLRPRLAELQNKAQ
jgi:repressor LexA